MAKDKLKRFLRQTVGQALRNFNKRTSNEQCCCQIIKLNGDGTGTLPDGTKVSVREAGLPGQYTLACKVHSDSWVADAEQEIYTVINSEVPPALLMYRDDQGLYVRKLGSDRKFRVPTLLNSKIPANQYTGGFSADLSYIWMGGNYTTNHPSDENYNSANPTEVIVEWAYFTDYFLYENDQDSTIVTKSALPTISPVSAATGKGSYNLSESWRSNIKDSITPPSPLGVGETGIETEGLSGVDRAKNIYRYWPSDETEVISSEDILEFIQSIADFLEITLDEALNLFPGALDNGAEVNSEPNRFFPFVRSEFIEHSDPVEITSENGFPNFITEDRDGYWSRTWNYNHNLTTPVFMNVAFAFNVNSAGSPVMDVIATYQTVTIYYVQDNTQESWERYFYDTDNINDNGPDYDVDYGRLNDTEFSYTDISVNYAFEDPILGQGGQGFLDYTAVPLDPIETNHNFRLVAEGRSYGSPTGSPDEEASVTYYPQIYFDDYYGGLQTRCEDQTPDCEYWIATGDYPGPAVIQARFAVFGGVGIFVPPVHTLPMETGSQTTTRFDGSEVTVNQTFVESPTLFATDIPDEPVFAGLFLNPWGVADSFANAYQFGRGVMAVYNVQNSPTVGYIDRPPANSNDYDTVINTYLGISGGRAVVVKEDFYSAYAYNRDYISTSGQVVKLQPPDAFTDTLFIDSGTYPLEVQRLKGYDSDKFFQYGTYAQDGKTMEFLDDVTVGLDGSISYNIAREGQLPSGSFGTLLDYATSKPNRLGLS